MPTEHEIEKAARKVADVIHKVNPSLGYDRILEDARNYVRAALAVMAAKRP
jgi:hypothetical protein